MRRAVRAWLRRAAGVFTRGRTERELAGELQSHLELHIADNMRRGMSEEAARRDARLRLGGMEAAKEAYRDRARIPALETTMQDVRYAGRMLRKNPGFTAVAVATLAVGIGANTAIYSVVNAVVLSPLRYMEPERLFVLQEIIPKMRDRYPLLPANAGHFTEWRKRLRSMEDAAAVDFRTITLSGSGEPERLGGALVTANLFEVLGVPAAVGRTFVEGEDKPGKDEAVVIAHSLWQRRFGKQATVVGSKVVVDGVPHTVAGVLPDWFVFPSPPELMPLGPSHPRPELFQPLVFSPDVLNSAGEFNYGVIARARRGAGRETLAAELNVVQAQIGRGSKYPTELEGWVAPLQSQMIRGVRDGLWLLMLSVGAVMLIICVNMANLLLARTTTRQREFAIRAALGAGRGRVVRQLLTEAMLLALLGGAAGGVLAVWAKDALVRLAPVDLPRVTEIAVDAGVLGFAFAASVVTGLLFGAAPAWRLYRMAPNASLGAAGRSAAGGSGGRTRNVLVAAEVALCTVLLIVSGLLLGSFARLMAVDKGFDPRHVIAADLNLPATRYTKGDERVRFFERAVEEMRSLPGVESAALITVLPLHGTASVNLMSPPGDKRPPFERPIAKYSFVSPGYLETMHIAIRQGRSLEEKDRGRRVAVVSEYTAAKLWPGENPLGKKFHAGDTDNPLFEVVGVAADVRAVSLNEEMGLAVYTPVWGRGPSEAAIVMRTRADAGRLAGAVRDRIRRLDAEVPAPRLREMTAVVSDSVANRRFQLRAVLLFAALAVGLASLGIFGVVSYSVSRRTGEIGVRMALGASAAQVRAMVLRQGMLPAAAGCAVGLALAAAAARGLRALLFGVAPGEPAIYAAALALLGGVTLAACYLPARRATRVDPMVALRYE